MLRARVSPAKLLFVAVFVSLFVTSLCVVPAADEEAKAQQGPPFPLHSIEGVGGLPITPSAYLVDPGPEGTLISKPNVSAHAIWVGDKDLQVVAATWTLLRRIELGYAVNRLGIDDLDKEVRRSTGGMANIGTDHIWLHHLNARVNFIPENMCDVPYIPAITAGVHYKYNNNIDEINRDLGDALETVGYNDNDGLDFTLTASKTITSLPRPVMFSVGARASRASQFGLMGFGDDYMVSFEGNVDVLVTDKLAIGAEFRDKPDVMGRIKDLVAEDDAWWDVHAAYFLSPKSSIYAVAGDAGGVANHTDEMFWGVVLKYDF
jgi:hypothetical protein